MAASSSPKNIIRHETLGRLGSLEVRLARSAAEVRRAQRLRYRVFYKEGVGDRRRRDAAVARRDIDAFDAICDHLLVVDHADAATARRAPVVGTYRLLRQDIAERHGGFYTAAEFDIGELVAQHPQLRFLELGRSCVLAPYRNKRTVELLWHGIWTYVLQHRARRDDRLRLARRHRSRRAGAAAVLPASFRARAGGVARAARCRSAMSR